MKIDVEKSLTTGYLEYDKSTLGQFDEVLNVIVYGAVPVIFIIPFVKALIEGIIPSLRSTFLMMVAILIGFLFIRRLLEVDKLERISGIDFKRNRSVIREIVHQTDWEVIDDNQNYLLANLPTGPWAWRRQLFILFDQRDILINSTTFGLHDLKSPFHYLGNKKATEYIIRGFNEKLAT